MRKGGTARAIRFMVIFGFIIVVFGSMQFIRIRKNYRELHKRVTQLEMICNRSDLK